MGDGLIGFAVGSIEKFFSSSDAIASLLLRVVADSDKKLHVFFCLNLEHGLHSFSTTPGDLFGNHVFDPRKLKNLVDGARSVASDLCNLGTGMSLCTKKSYDSVFPFLGAIARGELSWNVVFIP